MPKPKVLLDPYPRRIEWLFASNEWQRLTDLAEVLWARDEAIPEDDFAAIAEGLDAVITCGWRFGALDRTPKLRAILEVGGSHPSPQLLDYTT